MSERALLCPKVPRRWSLLLILLISVIKGKAVPLQAWTGPQDSRRLRSQDFLTSAHEGGRLSALRTGRLYPQNLPGTHFQRLSRPQGTWNCQMPRKKAPATPGIDPGTFQPVAKCDKSNIRTKKSIQHWRTDTDRGKRKYSVPMPVCPLQIPMDWPGMEPGPHG
jgi:hypothetical protein